MKCKKVLSGILSLLLVATSLPTSVFAENVKEESVEVIKEVSNQSERTSLFNSGWKFNLGDIPAAKDKNFDDETWRELELPHDWSIELDFNKNSPSTHEGGYLDGGIGWYRKTFVLSSDMQGKDISIDFDGVYMDSYVYVNGVQVGNHPYGYTPFSFDIGNNLVCDGVTENVIAVKVNNRQPSSRWYSGSGIYRDVNLTVTNKVHVEKYGTFVTTPNIEEEYKTGKATANIKTNIVNEENLSKEVKVKSTILDKDGNVVGEKISTDTILNGATKEFNEDIEVSNPNLWGTENAYMYKLLTTIIINENVVDKYETEFGMRWFEFTNDNGFFLNGEQMKLEGVCMHHDQGALGAVSNEASIERQVKILKDMGVNSIRVTHNPASKQLIDICNREGILLVEEAFDTWYGGKKTYDYGRFFEQRSIHGDMTWAEFDIKQMVERGKNAPSIIMWSIGNEISESSQAKGAQTAQNLNDWVKEVDPTRPTTFGEDKFRRGTGQGGHETVASIVDIVGFNYAEDRYDSMSDKHPDWKIYGSETSSGTRSRGVYAHPGQTIVQDNHADKQQSSYDNDHVSWGKTAEAAWKMDRDRGNIAGEYIWTGFDYIGEPTPYYDSFPAKSSYFGAIDTAGFEKDAFYFYKSQWTDEPMVHLLPHWSWENDNSIKVDGDKILLYAYTNANTVDLYYNEDVNSEEIGELVGTDTYEVTNAGYNGKYKETNDGKLHMEFRIQYKPGKITAIAKDENGQEVSRDVIKTANEATGINLSADRQVIEADGYDLSFITVDIVDENETLVPNADNLVNFEVSGNGKIVGVDNGNAASVERYKDNKRKAFNGKALVIVQSTDNAGSFTLTATSEGISSDSINVYTVEESDIEQNKIVGYDVSDIVVPVNGELNLPGRVDALYTDGSKSEVNVTWEEISSDKLAIAGTFKVNGTVENSNVPVVINVIVKDIIGILDARILVKVGEIVELPKEVSSVSNDGSIDNHSVVWERQLTEADVAEAGTVEIAGTIEGVSGLKGKAIVVVSDNYEFKNIALNEGGTYPKAFTTYAGSDNIININDGVISKGNSPKNRWTNWGKSGGNYDDYVGIEFNKQYNINKVGLSLYRDSGVELPSEIIVEYFDGENWMEVSNQSKRVGFTVDGTEEITFDEITTNKVRVLLKENTTDKKAVGLTEFEVYSNFVAMEGTALLNDIKVNNISIEKFNENTLEYTVQLPYGEEVPTVIATAKDNASIFVVPALTNNGTTKILVTAEDGKLNKTYLVKFRENDPTLETAEISLSKENIVEDDIVDIILGTKLQDGSKVDMSNVDIKYYITSENGAEVKVDANKLYAYTSGDISLYAEATYKGVTKTTNIIKVNIAKNNQDKNIISYEKVTIETEKGVKPELPENLKATFDVGLSRYVKVTWEEISEEHYNKYGVFEVEGTVEGQELKPTIKVMVKGISAVDNISVATNIGVEPKISEAIKVYYTDGTSKDVEVTWEEYDRELLNSEGTFTIYGQVEGLDIKSKATIRVTSDVISGDNIARARNGYDIPMAIASYTNDVKVNASSKDSIIKVNDDIIEHNISATNNRWSNWKKTNPNASDWVGVIFGSGMPEKKYINNLEVDFFEDSGSKIPENIKVQYYIGEETILPQNAGHVASEENSLLNNDANWIDVSNLEFNPSITTGSDTNYYKFDMIKTTALRVKMEAKTDMALAITEIKAFEEKVVSNSDFNVNMVKVNGENLEGFSEDRFNYTIKVNKNEVLPEITVDTNNNASTSIVYTVNDYEKFDVIFKSEDGLREKKYSITVERNSEVEVDKTALKKAIDFAEDKVLNGELEGAAVEVVKEFEESLKEAKAIYLNENATLEEVDSAFRRLMNAIDMIEVKPGDKTELQRLVEIVNTLNKGDYTEETWNKLEKELEDVKIVLEDERASQKQVDKAKENLAKAIDGLEIREIVVEKVENLNAKVSEKLVELTWDAPSSLVGITGYVIYKDGKELAEVVVGIEKYNVENLKSNTIYGFKVVTKYSNGKVSKPVSINTRTKNTK